MQVLLPSNFFLSNVPAGPSMPTEEKHLLTPQLGHIHYHSSAKKYLQYSDQSCIKTFASFLFIQYFQITSCLNSQMNYFEQQFICHYPIQEILS